MRGRQPETSETFPQPVSVFLQPVPPSQAFPQPIPHPTAQAPPVQFVPPT